MSEKIEWYREVLELEPNSRVFLPLARLLAAEGRDGEAIAVLNAGLFRHPEYLEARLLLVELLYKSGRQAECDEQVAELAAMFKKYAGFWQAWAACLGSSQADADTASMLRFLAASFLQGPLSLHEVINRGLATYFAADRPARPAEAADAAKDAQASSAHDASHKPAMRIAASEAAAPEIAAPESFAPENAQPENAATESPEAESGRPATPDLPPDIPSDITKEQAAPQEPLAQDFSAPDILNQDVSAADEPAQEAAATSAGAPEPEYSQAASEAAPETPPEAHAVSEESAAQVSAAAAEHAEAEAAQENAELVPAEAPEAGAGLAAEDAGDAEYEAFAASPEAAADPRSAPEDIEETAGIGGESFRRLFEEDDEGAARFAPERESVPAAGGAVSGAEEIQAAAEPDYAASGDDGASAMSETYSIRTRSMADVLADQEDYRGALDIYRELLAGARDGARRKELEARVEELSRKLEESEALSALAAEGDGNLAAAVPSRSRDKLIGMLEALARRVEARAQG